MIDEIEGNFRRSPVIPTLTSSNRVQKIPLPNFPSYGYVAQLGEADKEKCPVDIFPAERRVSG